MKKASYSPLILITLFLILGGTLLFSSSRLDSGFNLISGLGIFNPVVNNVLLNSTYRTNKTTENLTLYWNSTDDDGERVINITDWRRNGRSISLLNMPFENNSNSENNATDYSLYKNNGSVSGAVWIKNGFIGGAYNFTALSDYITIGNQVMRTNKVTYGGWVKFDTFTCPDSFCVAFSQDNSAFAGYSLGTDSAGGVGCAIGVTSTGYTTQLTAGVWYNLLCRHNGTKMALYVNGQQVDTVASTTANPTATSYVIGERPDYGCCGFKGTIDQATVYN